MSQVSFNTEFEGQRVTVIAGWDAPLQHYHMTVYRTRDDQVLWCNLNFKDPFPKSIQKYKRGLQEMGIEVPLYFWKLVSMKMGNVRVIFE